jgi:hypothetical protein
MAILLAVAIVVAPLTDVRSTVRRGIAAHYRDGLMERVAERRGLRTDGCLAASNIGNPLGSYVSVNGTRCRIVDVCHPRDCKRLRKRGIIVELSFRSAKRICSISRYGQEPPEKCPVTVRF